MPCPKKILSKIANKAEDLSDKLTLNDVIKTVGISKNLIKDLKKKFGTGTTLRNNEIKDLMKIIKSLENRGISLKETTRKTTSLEGGFLNFLRPLMTADLISMKNVLTPLAKSVLISLGLPAAAPATDEPIQKEIYESGTTALINLNEEMEDITRIVKSLEVSGLLTKGITETIKNKTKEQKSGFLPILLGTLAASVLGMY